MENALILGRTLRIVPPRPVLGDWIRDVGEFVTEAGGSVADVWQAHEQAEAAEEQREALEARAAQEAARAAAEAARARQAEAQGAGWTPYLLVGGAVLAAGGIVAYALLKK